MILSIFTKFNKMNGFNVVKFIIPLTFRKSVFNISSTAGQQMAQKCKRKNAAKTFLRLISQKLSKKANLKLSRLTEALVTIFVNIKVSRTKHCLNKHKRPLHSEVTSKIKVQMTSVAKCPALLCSRHFDVDKNRYQRFSELLSFKLAFFDNF